MLTVNYPPQLQVELLPKGAVPEIRFELPHIQFPEEINLTEHFLDRNLTEDRAQRTAFYSGDRQITYEDLYQLVNKLANGLRGLGIGKGDRVVLRMPSCLEFVTSALALHRLGAVPVPTMILLRERVITHVANTSEAKALISMHDLLEDVELGRDKYETVQHLIAVGGDPAELRSRGYLSQEELIRTSGDRIESVKVKRDDVGAVFFTSGTTGMPKGCMHMHMNMMAVPQIMGDYYFGGIRPTDVVGGMPPLAFVAGYALSMLLPIFYGVPSVLLEGRLTPEQRFETIQKYGISIFIASPAAYNQMLNVPGAEKKYDTSSLRITVAGTAPLLPATFQQWKSRFGTELKNVMGSTETFAAYLGTWLPESNPISLGHPLPGFEVRVIDDQGRDCPTGTVGRLALRGISGVMYWRNPEKQKESVVDGWSLTGDLVYQDKDGGYWHVSRSDDIIKSRGYRVSPGEVEDALMEHSAVFEPAVIGVPDPVQGQRVKAFVALKDGQQGSVELAEELRKFVRARVAAYMVPSEIEFIDSLPKTETGKTRRVELRQMEEQRSGQPQ